MADETIRTKLEFDGAQAIKALKEVEKQAETTAGKAQLLAHKLADYSRSLGQDWRKTLDQMKMVGQESGMKFTTPLGLDVTNAVYENTKATLENAEAKGKYITEDNKAAASTRNFAGEAKRATGQISLFGHSIDALIGTDREDTRPGWSGHELPRLFSPPVARLVLDNSFMLNGLG